MSSPEKSADRSGFANGWNWRVPVALTASVRNRGKGAKEIQGGRGYLHHASKDDPQYAIKSDKTDHVALHKGGALKLMRG